jgi:DNA mismatch repair protein MutL
MTDIIKLLPESVSNQIAAGEVVQRPASVVKELLENAIDAGAEYIRLQLKDAGKTLIQVADDGCGMSETDARMSLERHATSKITKAEDLFAIKTMGFRGEALASIAAVSQMEIKTRRKEDEVGIKIQVAGYDIQSQQPEVMPAGTVITVKNLFFNIPARRNFLKSDKVELRHCIEEFQRIAMVYPDIRFSMTHNQHTVFLLEPETLKKRVVDIFGTSLAKNLIPLQSDSDIVNIHGFVGKPENAKKSRNEQFFFANKRFIRQPYFNHAVETAFNELIPDGHHPSYFIFLEVPTERVDINIHPTKTEVNFQDARAIYPLLMSAVKEAIGKFNLSPSIDFDVEQSFQIAPPKDLSQIKSPEISFNKDYNPFEKQQNPQTSIPYSPNRIKHSGWGGLELPETEADSVLKQNYDETKSETFPQNRHEEGIFQLSRTFIVTSVKSGMMIIHQQAAHERILYERFMKKLEMRKPGSQQQLFPQNVTLAPSDAGLLRSLNTELREVGFDIKNITANTFIINGLPEDMTEKEDVGVFLDKMLDSYKQNQQLLKNDKTINLALAMAKNMAIKPGRLLLAEEMKNIIESLFACQVPERAPSGKPTLVIIKPEEILEKFK